MIDSEIIALIAFGIFIYCIGVISGRTYEILKRLNK
jgi:hypothetical protein